MRVWTAIGLGKVLEYETAKVTIDYYRVRQYKPYDECSKLLDQRK
jgi:hypothetical protein